MNGQHLSCRPAAALNMDEKRFVVASLPGPAHGNPYLRLFYDALRPIGVETYSEPEVDLAWGRVHFGRIDALHFHWPEYVWRRAIAGQGTAARWRALWARVPGAWRTEALGRALVRTSLFQKVRRRIVKLLLVMRFKEFLLAARQQNVKILWTVHNVESHERWDLLDAYGFRVLGRLADLVICHSEHAKAECSRRYEPGCPVVLMPLGNCDGVYPAARPREQVLAELGLDPRLPVAGCLGILREYKGLDVALKAVQLLEGKIQLICAGAPVRLFPLDALEKLAAETPGTRLIARHLSDQEFADLSSACDVMLLPYRKITGSSALLAALTFERGVIASDLPYFREILSEIGDAGVLVPPGRADAIADALTDYLRLDPVRRSAAARTLAEKYAWPRVIQPVAAAIQSLRIN